MKAEGQVEEVPIILHPKKRLFDLKREVLFFRGFLL
jgi:hypothetical protein